MTDNDADRPAQSSAAADDVPPFALAGRKVPGSHGARWIGEGWRAFKARPLKWIGLGVLYVLVELLLSAVPLVNVLSMIVTPLLLGGLMFACERFRTTGDVNIGDLFAGFQRKLGALALVGLLTLAIIAIGLVVLILLVGVGPFGQMMSHQPDVAPAFSMGGIVGLLVYAVILSIAMAAAWFAPALVLLHDVKPVRAMRASFVAVCRNWLAGLVYLLLLALLLIVGAIPLLLGLLVVIPLSFLALYASYRDIFVDG
jgi:uncharacterized membrane protein